MSAWITPGFEHLELSTQRVIKAALDRKIDVEILDPVNQWIRLKKGQKHEIIRQGNETSADNYVTSLILGDKSLQKKLLQEAHISVPDGKKFTDKATALEQFSDYRKGQFVVKPTTTNYGVGITILPSNTDIETYQTAVKNAFNFDDSIIIETFLPGIECRFLVIDGICRAVLHRVPANVTGNGIDDISTLVAEKNKDPKRGTNYRTPLEKIQLSAPEITTLEEQNLSVTSVPEKDQIVWLRKNSNISTGGDSLDYTDIVDPSYLRIAEAATKTVGAKICGVDLMLSEPKQAATSQNHGIIELNYNPVLYFHDFPHTGKNRNVAPYILDLLGF